jgi:addiction module HigA family antidote
VDYHLKEAAARLRVTRATLSHILNGHAGIAAGMPLRPSAALGTAPDFWLKMQGQYDLWHALNFIRATCGQNPATN